MNWNEVNIPFLQYILFISIVFEASLLCIYVSGVVLTEYSPYLTVFFTGVTEKCFIVMFIVFTD